MGEEASVDEEIAQVWIKEKLPEVIQDYKNVDIFNCDETGIQYRALPRKSLTKKGKVMKGAKKNKVKLTAFFCCSAAGEKLPPLLIGTAKNQGALGRPSVLKVQGSFGTATKLDG